MDLEKEQKLRDEFMKQVYSDVAFDHGQNPRNMGILEESNAFGFMMEDCGDTIAIWLKIKGNKIEEISFSTDGCINALAVGSMTTELAKGKTISDAQKISQQDILNALGGLPETGFGCALTATNALKEALKNFQPE